jgi:hypothetical protein
MENEEKGIKLGKAVEQPEEENEFKLSYWFKNHKFVVTLFLAAFILTIIGIALFIKQCIKDWKETLSLVSGLSPILILGIVTIIWAIVDIKRNKKKI